MLQHFHIYLLIKRRYFSTASYVWEVCQLFRPKISLSSGTFTKLESSLEDVCASNKRLQNRN